MPVNTRSLPSLKTYTAGSNVAILQLVGVGDAEVHCTALAQLTGDECLGHRLRGIVRRATEKRLAAVGSSHSDTDSSDVVT